MIETIDVGIIDGMFIQAVYKDGELIGHNATPVMAEGAAS